MSLARRIGAAVLAVAAIAIWFGMKPSPPSTATYQAAIAAALVADKTNGASAQSAPQQQVVNGWTARDLLTIVAQEGAQQAGAADERPAALLVVVVLGVALLLATSITPAPTTPDARSYYTQSMEPEPELPDAARIQ